METNPNIWIHSNYTIAQDRPYLIQAGIDGIGRVCELQNIAPGVYNNDRKAALIISSVENSVFDKKRQQIDADDLALSLRRETNIANPNYIDLLITDKDLCSDHSSPIFSQRIYDWRLSILSVARYINATEDKDTQGLLVEHDVIHEYAHLAGRGMYSNADFGIEDCDNTSCIMHHADSIKQTIELVTSDSYKNDILAGFCINCFKKLYIKD